MRHVFSPDGQAAMIELLSRKPLLAFDFDGTLAPIVALPDHARLSFAVAGRLRLLAEHLPVAIVTGRATDDVKQRLHFHPHYVVGNHGAEDEFDLGGAGLRMSALDALRLDLQARAADLVAAGVAVEDKGQSIALHYRLSRRRDDAKALIHEILAAFGGTLHVFAGKMVVNVVATGAPDKASAVRRLLARSESNCALFAGDDVNDEPVFEAAEPDWLTVRVGRDCPNSRARYFLEGPHEMAMLLEYLLVHLGVIRNSPVSRPAAL